MSCWLAVLLIVVAAASGFVVGRFWELVDSLARGREPDALELRRGERLP